MTERHQCAGCPKESIMYMAPTGVWVVASAGEEGFGDWGHGGSVSAAQHWCAEYILLPWQDGTGCLNGT